MRAWWLLGVVACDGVAGDAGDNTAARGALSNTSGPSSLVLFLEAVGVPTESATPAALEHNFIGGTDDFDSAGFETVTGTSDGPSNVALLVQLGPALLTGQACLITNNNDDSDLMACSVSRSGDGSRTLEVSTTDDTDFYSRSTSDDFDYLSSTAVHRGVTQAWTIDIDAAGRVSGSTYYDVAYTTELSEPDVFVTGAVGAGPEGPAFCDFIGGECTNRPGETDCTGATCSVLLQEAFRADVTFEGFVLDGGAWPALSAGGRVDDDDDPSWAFGLGRKDTSDSAKPSAASAYLDDDDPVYLE